MCVCEKPSPSGRGAGVKNPYITFWELWGAETCYRAPDTGEVKGVETSFYSSAKVPRELMMTGKNHVRVEDAVRSLRTKLRLF